MQTENIPWLAGLLEGEGSFTLQLTTTKRNGRQWNYWRLKVQLAMTDLDVVERAQAVMGGVGKIYVSHRKTSYKNDPSKKHKDLYHWQVFNQTEAYALMVAVLPFMCERRTEEILDAILTWRSIKPKRIAGQCPKGHAYTEENSFIDKKGYRRCRACARARR